MHDDKETVEDRELRRLHRQLSEAIHSLDMPPSQNLEAMGMKVQVNTCPKDGKPVSIWIVTAHARHAHADLKVDNS